MMLSEIDEYKGHLFGLVKFTQYIDSLKSGNLYMNNLKYYIDLEKRTGIKGMGDKLEASHVVSEGTFKVYEQDTKNLVFEGIASSMTFRLNADEQVPVYCMYAVDGNVLEVIDEEDDFYTTKFKISNNQIESLVSEFGDKMLFINPKPFLERVVSAFEEKGYSYKAAKVNYDNYEVNNTTRIDSYKKMNNDIFFWKDEYFKSQNEYRIVITDLMIDKPLEINIGQINDISKEIKISDFFSDRFEIKIRKQK